MFWRNFFTGSLPLHKALFFVFYPITVICIALIYYKYPFYFELVPNPVNHGKANGIFVGVLWAICLLTGGFTMLSAEKSRIFYLKYLTYLSVFIVFAYPWRMLFFMILFLFISPFIDSFS